MAGNFLAESGRERAFGPGHGIEVLFPFFLVELGVKFWWVLLSRGITAALGIFEFLKVFIVPELDEFVDEFLLGDFADEELVELEGPGDFVWYFFLELAESFHVVDDGGEDLDEFLVELSVLLVGLSLAFFLLESISERGIQFCVRFFLW